MKQWAVPIVAILVVAGCAETTEPTVDGAVEDEPVEKTLFTVHEEVEALRAEVAAAVTAGDPVSLSAKPVYENDLTRSVDPVDYDVVLDRDDRFVTNSTWVESGPVVDTLGNLSLYEGHVAGDASQLVRLAIGPDWARGTVRIGDMNHLFRLGLENNIPPSANVTGDGFRAQIPETFDGPMYKDHDCLSLAPTDLTPMVEVGHSAAQQLVADLILDADDLFAQQMGNHSVPFMVAMMYEADAIYQYEVGINFHIAGVHVHDNYTYEPGDFASLSAYWNEREDDRDVVHMFTGSESSFAQANCIGGAGIPSEAYTFTPLNWEYQYEVFHITALVHELGHIFNAHHHYGNHVEAGGELATLMIQGYTPGVNPVFSTASKTTIRGWAEAHVG